MKYRLSNKGFTLLELMVVVAIIAILSAVAVPNFKKYKGKARSTEAKLQLSSIYLAERTFYIDYETYASCLKIVGYDPTGKDISRYYAIGFAKASSKLNYTAAAAGATLLCVAPGIRCSATASFPNCHSYSASKGAEGQSPMADVSKEPNALIKSSEEFTAAAVGAISSDSLEGDRWTVDQGKKIVHTNVGY